VRVLNWVTVAHRISSFLLEKLVTRLSRVRVRNALWDNDIQHSVRCI
jgi:hypothetical protein